jgi:hypothetical protein
LNEVLGAFGPEQVLPDFVFPQGFRDGGQKLQVRLAVFRSGGYEEYDTGGLTIQALKVHSVGNKARSKSHPSIPSERPWGIANP